MKRVKRGLLLLAMLALFNFPLTASAAKKVTFSSAASTKSVKISLSGNWKATTKADWLTLEKSGNKLMITAATNSDEVRSTTVKVKNSKKSISITVKQKAESLPSNSFKFDWTKCQKADVTEKFLAKVLTISAKLNVKPDNLMAVMAFESGLNHKAVNSNSNATGLIQFLPSTAKNLGTTVSKLKKMSAVKQLNYVYKYLSQQTGLKTLGDLYMAILWPKGVGKKNSYVLWKKGTQEYSHNSKLDVNNDGKVTKGEALAKVLPREKLM